MFISILDSILDVNAVFDIVDTLWILFASLIIGFVLAIVYIVTHRKEGYQVSFPVTIVLLPVIVSSIIYLVGNYSIQTGAALGLAGIFALTRFRSNPLETRDLSYIFLIVAIGIACGLGYLAYAAILAIIMSIVLLFIYFVNFGVPNSQTMRLKIVVPENTNYDNLFDDILEYYCNKYYLNKVRTTDFGTLFELTYTIEIKKIEDQKAFIDEIRSRNSNLNVTLVVVRYNSTDGK